MWRLWRTAQQTHSRPSDLVCIEDRLTALLFDNAVTFFGTAIENALHEQVNRGSQSSPRYESKYDLRDLLEPDFVIPDDPKPRRIRQKGQGSTGIAQILALSAEGNANIKRWVHESLLPEKVEAEDGN